MGLLEQIFEAGVVGAGGAGFPTHKKLTDGVRALVINAAECEPLLASDRYAMRAFPDEIIEALCEIKSVFGISRVVIGTKKKYTREIAALEKAIERRGGGIEIFGVSGFYPAGDEQVLIYEIFGETVPPGGIPLALGIVVLNVTTALNIRRAMSGKPVTRRYVTVTGAVQRPVIVDAPIGASVADCVDAAGGPSAERYAIIKGGPMMGPQFPMEKSGELFIGKADGGIVLLPEDNPLVLLAKKPLEHMMNQAKSVCMQCSYCTEMCPRYLIGHKLRPNRVMRSVATGTCAADLTDALLCCECGACELFACPMGLSPRRVNIHIKGLLRQEGAKVADKTVYPRQSDTREYRRIAQSRLIKRWGMDGYPKAIDEVVVCEPERVTIPLRHGVGRPSEPRVGPGDHVLAGDVIAGVEFGDVGCMVHASVAGVVAAVGENGVTIERKGEKVG